MALIDELAARSGRVMLEDGTWINIGELMKPGGDGIPAKVIGSNTADPTVVPLKVRDEAFYGYNLGHLDAFKASIAADAADGIVPVLCMGDSISEGGLSTDFLTDGYTSILRDILQSRYGNAGAGFISSWRRTNGTPTFAWTTTGTITDSGHAQKMAFGATAELSFNGTGVEIVYFQTDGSLTGDFTVSIDGGAATTYSAVGTPLGPASISVTGLTDGAHTVTITSNTSGRFFYLSGASEINGATGIRLINIARWGDRVSALTSNLRALGTFFVPSLALIAYTANDYTNQTGLSDYKSSLASAIDDLKAVGSSILIVVNGLRGQAEQVDQKWYTRMLYELADEKDVALVDVNKKWGSYDDATTAGLINDAASEVHPTDAGHRDLADTIMDYLW